MQPVIVRGGGGGSCNLYGQGTSILSRGKYQSIIPIMYTLLVCRNSSLDCCDPNYDLALFFKSFFFFLNRMVCCRLPQSE